ncbi:MAG: Outer membrane protein H precursor [Cytophagales bacterium]|jgi:outer membrane protein|nr:OmpH family outer membrane protein [Bacteroidota bacterium]MBS1979920.1 OmpH family outer membrane protein [Bacteroidota bacterium]WHZ07335.1 MAG: Outer membrane protein H precursor [Cytophagales bacterium]
MRTLLSLILCLTLVAVNAQEHTTQKIGYADTDYIMSQMPAVKTIESELKTHSAQLDNQLKAKYEDIQTKYKAYQGMPATTPEAIKADKERELTSLQENFQKFQQEAQSSLQKKQAELLDPIYKKIGAATEEVAKENGYSFIINPHLTNGGDVLLYTDEKFNISDLVLKKMGITPTAQTPTTPVKKN